MSWAFLVSMGASGGVLLMWDTRVVESMEECIGNFPVACSFKNVENGWVRVSFRGCLWSDFK